MLFRSGRIIEMKVQLGDKVSKGSEIAVIEAAAGESAAKAPAAAPAAAAPAATAAAPASASPAAAPAARPGPQAAPATDHQADVECDMLVIGGGPGGYSAAFRAADLGMKVVIP